MHVKRGEAGSVGVLLWQWPGTETVMQLQSFHLGTNKHIGGTVAKV
ncbi:hypothetical protein N8087_01590 [Porticoccaceae bacterium]|nr:hypothetical protein [Porticoccaceae bacterium]